MGKAVRSYLTINAIDGSVIDRGLGYSSTFKKAGMDRMENAMPAFLLPKSKTAWVRVTNIGSVDTLSRQIVAWGPS